MGIYTVSHPEGGTLVGIFPLLTRRRHPGGYIPSHIHPKEAPWWVYTIIHPGETPWWVLGKF